ncbi:hypothetical protein HYX01_03570 [Candidatus Woesearchaeota archaeon]|nr:hypothetical protein [Candidatus Woesearchaeota archaeon]
MKYTELIYVALFLLVLPLIAADTTILGCCTNPGAGSLICNVANRDVNCCPTDVASHTAYYDVSKGGPRTYDACIANFFTANIACEGNPKCAKGCCCTEANNVKSGRLITQAECQVPLTTLTGSDCNAVCEVSQCNDNIDNDGNGCIDYPLDRGCDASSDTQESGGSCVAATGTICGNPNYNPKISSFSASQPKGQKKIQLQWQTECGSNVISREIYRCTGRDCATFIKIGISNQDSFIDEDASLEFGAWYNYKIEIGFNLQTAKATSTAAASLGSLECWNRQDNTNFCIQPLYYEQYKNYLIWKNNLASADFNSWAARIFSSNFNKAFYCDNANVLSQAVKSCSDNEVCVISPNSPLCVKKESCSQNEANPFGLYSSQILCESKYCFYDKSVSIINSCFACDTKMSCYDYKSKGACEKDNCKIAVGKCEWKSLSDELGTGACIDTKKDNCVWCLSSGTAGIESLKAWNAVFEQCTSEKAAALSTNEFKCYYSQNSQKPSEEKVTDCKEIRCTDYKPEECVPNDLCGVNKCKNINGQCEKDADNNNIADCEPNANKDRCEQDVFAPETTITPLMERGIRWLSITVTDKTNSKDSYLIKATADNNLPEGYRTYLCKEPCSQNLPYEKSTTSGNLRIIGLNLYDGVTAAPLFSLAEGANTLKYYSQDPAKNIESAKSIAFFSYPGSSGAEVLRLELSNGNKVGDNYYTRDTKPTITVTFSEDAVITSASFSVKGAASAFTPSFDAGAKKTFVFTLPREFENGEYTFSLNAKNTKERLMGNPFSANIIIDNKNPEIESIEPANNALVAVADVPFVIKFKEVVAKERIDSIKINNEEKKEIFTTADNRIYRAAISLNDGSKEIVIDARDLAGNHLNYKSNFVVNSKGLEIKLKEPLFGVSPTYAFKIAVETDNDASCKYSMISGINFDLMADFPTTGRTRHEIADFNKDFSKIPDGNKNINKFYVTCKDPLKDTKTEVFDLSVDSEKPTFVSAYVNPNPIADIPRTANLKLETNKDTICKYSPTINNFDAMEHKFPRFDENVYAKIHEQEITVASDAQYKYYAACKSKNGLVSDAKEIAFSSNTALPIEIASKTSQFHKIRNVLLVVETNKKSQCKYSQSDATAMQGEVFTSEPSNVHRKSLELAPGKYAYYVSCVDAQKWSAPIKIEFVVDITAPIMKFVNDDSDLLSSPELTCDTARLRVKWLAEDEESGISYYTYSITNERGAVIVDWKNETRFSNPTERDEWLWIRNLKLDPDKYFFNVKATNNVGLVSDVTKSNGVIVTTDTSRCERPSRCEERGNCEINSQCKDNSQCRSRYCSAQNKCTEASCSDKVKNQEETDVDCGGACSKCANGKKCRTKLDCLFNLCDNGVCKNTDTCNDEILSGTETGIDCGGSCPVRCKAGVNCNRNDDCEKGLVCTAKKCSEPKIGSGKIPLEEKIEDNVGDGKQEKISGTQEEDKPKSKIAIISIIIFSVVMLGIGAYAGYYYFFKPKEEYALETTNKFTPISVPKQIIKSQYERAKEEEMLKKRREEKEKKRERIFESFGKRKVDELEKTGIKKDVTAKTKQPEDVFSKLRQISKKK